MNTFSATLVRTLPAAIAFAVTIPILGAAPAAAQSGRWDFKPASVNAGTSLAYYVVPEFPDAVVAIDCSGNDGRATLEVALELPAPAERPIVVDLVIDGRPFDLDGTAVDSAFHDAVIPSVPLDVDGPEIAALKAGSAAFVGVPDSGTAPLHFSLRGSHRALSALAAECGSVPAPAAAENGSAPPPAVAASIEAMKADCGSFGPPFRAEPGFLTSTDLNGDGIVDHIADYNRSNCIGFCGSGGCAVTVYASHGAGHRENKFLLPRLDVSRIVCSGGACRIR